MDVKRIVALVRGAVGNEPLALVGASALNALGYGRATADVDFAVLDSKQDRLIEALEGAGFRTLYRSEGYSNHVHTDPAWGRVDFIYLDATTAASLFKRAKAMDLAGEEVLVPSPEHLIAMKVHAIKNDPHRRLRDLADIEFLLGLPGADREAARRYFERAGLLKDWDELTRRS